MNDLIEPAVAAKAAAQGKRAVGGEAGVGDLRPRRARIRGAEHS